MSGLRGMPRPEIKNVIVSKPAITRSTRTGTERMSMVCEREGEGERKRTFRAHLLEMSLRPIVLTFAGLIGNSLAYRPPTSGAVGLAGVSTSGRRGSSVACMHDPCQAVTSLIPSRPKPCCHAIQPLDLASCSSASSDLFIRSVHQTCDLVNVSARLHNPSESSDIRLNSAQLSRNGRLDLLMLRLKQRLKRSSWSAEVDCRYFLHIVSILGFSTTPCFHVLVG